MRRRWEIVVFVLLALSSPVSSYAAGLCCQVSSGSQESLLDSSLPKAGRYSLQFSYSFTMMDDLKEGSDRIPLREVMNEGKYTKLPIDMHMYKYTVTGAYDFDDNVTVLLSIPYVRNTMDMKMGMMSMDMGMGITWMDSEMNPVQDLGDVSLMGLYHYYPRGTGVRSDILTFGLGVKTPTGTATEKNSSGKFIHAHMQPGTGSWDPLFTVMYTKDASPFLLQADLTYQLTTRNRDGYEFGDSLAANIAGRYALTSSFNLTAAITYLHVNRAKDHDGRYTDLTSLMDDPENTGGDSVWVSPGIKVRPFKNSSAAIDLRAQFPVWERVNGIQLVSSYRILAGITFNF
ncbi:MAG TPA: hypothetical protein VEP69_00730 [Thermodesulfovibrionales bacterium]|nr:hypothetical protein [Thermodesulfovibrionales bacterium]